MKPLGNLFHSAFCQNCINISQVFRYRFQEHTIINITQSISREVTERATRPVNILQDSFRIICRTNANQLLHFIIPHLRQFFRFHTLTENCLFQLISQNNMQAVSHLICHGTNVTGYHMIDFSVKVFQADFFKFRQILSQFFINRFPEIYISA